MYHDAKKESKKITMREKPKSALKISVEEAIEANRHLIKSKHEYEKEIFEFYSCTPDTMNLGITTQVIQERFLLNAMINREFYYNLCFKAIIKTIPRDLSEE